MKQLAMLPLDELVSSPADCLRLQLLRVRQLVHGTMWSDPRLEWTLQTNAIFEGVKLCRFSQLD